MQIWILKPEVEICDDLGVRPSLQPSMQAVLCALVLAGGEAVRAGVLKELIWESDVAEERVTSRLTTVISRLRGVLGAERLLHKSDGYQLVIREGDFVDLNVIRALVDQARVADPRTAAPLYEYALDRWDDPLLVRVPLTGRMQARLESLRLERSGLVEEHAEVLLRLGLHRELLQRLPALVRAEPFNEHLRGLLMRAYYLAGRKGEALVLYREGELAIRTGTGSRPGSQLQHLRAWIDANDPRLQPAPIPLPDNDALVVASGGSLETVSVSRMSCAVLGLSYNSYVDRAAVQIILTASPDIARLVVEGERYSARVTRRAVRDGIRQILDIGGLLPSGYSPHEVADLVAPGQTKVVYTSADRFLAQHGRSQVRPESVAWIHADLADPQSILDAPELKSLINLDEPVLVFIREQVNFIQDDRHLRSVIREIVDAVAPGSLFAFQIATGDGMWDLARAQVDSVFAGLPTPIVLRTRDQAMALYDGLELLPPSITDVTAVWSDRPAWRGSWRAYGGVGVKRGS